MILLTFAVVLTMMVSDENTTNRIEIAAQGMGIVWWLLDLIYAPLVVRSWHLAAAGLRYDAHSFMAHNLRLYRSS